MKARRRIRQIGETALFLAGLAVIPLLPRRWIVGLAVALGAIGFRFSRRDRAIALANLDLAYGPGEGESRKKEIARESFQTFARVMLDVLWFGVFSRRRLVRWVKIDPSFEHYLNESPVIAVTGHLGNWEVMGQMAGVLGKPPVSVAMPLRNPVVDRVLNRIRRRTSQQVVSRSGAMKHLMRTLRENGRVALLMDQNTPPNEGGEFVKFFGLPVPISKAAAMLSTRTGARVVLVACTPERDGSYVLRGWPAFGGAGANPARFTQDLAERMETVIRAYPGAWLWSYKRWKYIPNGLPADRYPFYAHPME